MYELYKIVLPDVEREEAQSMYIRGKNFQVGYTDKSIYIENGGVAEFSTYFNAFSIGKWSKYTDLHTVYLKLKVKGKGRIVLKHMYMIAGDFIDRTVSWMEFDTQDTQEYVLDFSHMLGKSGIIFFRVEAAGKRCLLKEASYMTKDVPAAVRLGIGICTYKREEYIRKLIENYTNYENKKNAKLFIADNGHTLGPSTVQGVHIFKNKNYGGAAGFSRCMYEIKAKEKQDGITHIVFMDDDISIDFSVFDKMTAFLSYRKSEYELHFLAGAMCSLDAPFLQYEKYASWRGDRFIQFAPEYDLREIKVIIANEREEKLNQSTAGWWCSCFSIKMAGANNYPFPCFFRGDDMEFTIRNGSNIITLNGINVWHEPFYKKYSIVSENYYLVRNTLVINALYLPHLPWKENVTFLKKRFMKAILTYDYRSAELILKALKDYGRGISFFEQTNPESLDKKLRKQNYKLLPMSEQLEEYTFLDIEYFLYHEKDKNKFSKLLRLALLNGYLLPKACYRPFAFTHIGFGSRSRNFYKTREVFVVDPFTNKGYFLIINKRRAVKLTMRFFIRLWRLGHRYNSIKADYQQGFYKLQTESFWKKYLGIRN